MREHLGRAVVSEDDLNDCQYHCYSHLKQEHRFTVRLIYEVITQDQQLLLLLGHKMVYETNMTEGDEFNNLIRPSSLNSSGTFSVRFAKDMSCIHTFSTKDSCVNDMIEYIVKAFG